MGYIFVEEIFMKVRANKKIYEVLPFTDNKKKIEEFAGKRSIVKTRIDGVGFAANHEYAIKGAIDTFWLTPDTIAIKNSKNEIYYIPRNTFNEIFGKEK